MAQFDVYRGEAGTAYLVDCQSDLLSDLSHRLTVPLLDESDAPIAGARLNPVFVVGGRRVVMMTQYAAAFPKAELRRPVASLEDHRFTIIAAIDVLLSGV